ncbi:MAG TPA: S8 family serine peptidase [Polyangiaceae bacterium]|nr:S8 family serine peptidase [Polyangiaceae bacterium]
MSRPQVQSLVERLCPITRFAGRGVCIAFVDSGFYPHADLVQPRGRIRAYVDVTREQPEPSELLSRKSWSWHGTMTVCCAAGNGYLSGGRYRGLASESDVVLVKAKDEERDGILGSHVAAALRVPLRHRDLGVRVVSISLGVEPEDPDARAVEQAVGELVEAGIVVVTAAGNVPNRAPTPPASAAAAITVGGMEDRNNVFPSDDRPWPSSHGEVAPGVHKPDLLAPAIWVPAPMVPGTFQAREAHALYDLITVLEEMRLEPSREDGARAALESFYDAVDGRIAAQKYIAPDYQHVDGTSFAAPIVAAAVAQMLEANPELSPAEVKRGLLETARALPDVPREVQGAGVVEPAAAAEWAAARKPRPSEP